MMEDIVTVLSVIAVSAITFFLGNLMRVGKPKKGDEQPPKNLAADTARDNIQQTFQDQVADVAEDLESKDSAERLATRANARRRRK